MPGTTRERHEGRDPQFPFRARPRWSDDGTRQPRHPRDRLGARPIANTDVFCFGPPNWEGDLPPNLFHPSRVLRGVHAGVRVGGNESGIPTVNGAIVFDDRYIGKPLVPRHGWSMPDASRWPSWACEDGRARRLGSWSAGGLAPTAFTARPFLAGADRRLHRARQIGDPITQKKMLDMLLEARDAGLIASTDNAQAGFRPRLAKWRSKPEVSIDLAAAPSSRSGFPHGDLLGIPRADDGTCILTMLGAFEATAAVHEVEPPWWRRSPMTALPRASRRGRRGPPPTRVPSRRCTHPSRERMVALSTRLCPPRERRIQRLACLLARPNVASKEDWVRQYDHEVIAQTAVKPLLALSATARLMRPSSHPARLQPRTGDSNGIVPATRTSMPARCRCRGRSGTKRGCAGVDVDRMAGLDNFCWPDPIVSEKTPDGRFKLAQLVRATVN